MVEIADPAGLIQELARRISYLKLAEEVGVPQEALRALGETGHGRERHSRLAWLGHGSRDLPHIATDFGIAEESRQVTWRLIRSAYRHGLFSVLPAHGIQPVSYDIRSPFDLQAPPVGFDQDPPIVPLINRPTDIAGFKVGFPLGLPASVLAANSQWIEFYARRGFDILTYKTVRTIYRQEHPWPQWVFLEDPQTIDDPKNVKFTGYPGYWPDDLSTVSMANSFGVPSFGPEWWMDDVRRARRVISEGHQVLIVSVVASVSHPDDALIADFVKAATLAKTAGAQIVEANFSCPNVQGDKTGEVYQMPQLASQVACAIRDAIKPTPLFVKIGYLNVSDLRAFVASVTQFVDGIVAINTISGEVADESGKQAFPDNPENPEGRDKPAVKRNKAGVSGWAIKERAQEVARHLVALRKDAVTHRGRRLTILGVGGVTTPSDVDDYLRIGVDGVESCTGAFLNPNLGLEVRFDRARARRRPGRIALGLKVIGKILQDAVVRPTKSSRIRVDRNTGTVLVEPLDR